MPSRRAAPIQMRERQTRVRIKEQFMAQLEDVRDQGFFDELSPPQRTDAELALTLCILRSDLYDEALNVIGDRQRRRVSA